MIQWLVSGVLGALMALLVALGLAGAPHGGATVQGVAVATPTATPAAVATATPAASSEDAHTHQAEFDGYMDEIYGPLHDLRDSFDSMSALMEAPYVTDEGWRKDANAAFDGIQAAHTALLQVLPPERLATAHDALTTGTEKCSQGAEVARQSIEEDSVLGLYAAAQLMKACAEGVTEAGEMLTQMGLGG